MYIIKCQSFPIKYFKKNAKRPNFRIKHITLITFNIKSGGIFLKKQTNRGKNFPLWKIIRRNEYKKRTLNVMTDEEYADYEIQSPQEKRRLIKELAHEYGFLGRRDQNYRSVRSQ